MFHLIACLCLSVVLLAANFCTALPPGVDLEGSDTLHCDETLEVCEDSGGTDAIDDASDYLGTHLLQRGLDLHRGLARNVKEVQISGEADVEPDVAASTPKESNSVQELQISGEADVTASPHLIPSGQAKPARAAHSGISPAWTLGKIEKPMGTRDMGGWIKAIYTPEQQQRLNIDEEGNSQKAHVEAVAAAPLLTKHLSENSNHEHPHKEYDLQTSMRKYAMKQVHFNRQHLWVGAVLAFILVSTFLGICVCRCSGVCKCGVVRRRLRLLRVADDMEEDTESNSAIPKNIGTADIKGATDGTPEADPEWTNEDTYSATVLEKASATDVIKPDGNVNPEDYGFAWSGARFVLPPQSLARLGTGQWTATGMSGKEFVRASISDVPENGSTILTISAYSSDADFAQKWKFTKSPLTGIVPIFDENGALYGTVEPVPGGTRCLVKHNGMVAMSVEIDDHAELSSTAFSSAGRPIASSFKNSQDGSKGPESGETWKVQVKPETDAIFVAGCMLAHMLLGCGAGTGTPAFRKLYE